MSTYLITGASRGVGLELTRQLLTHPVDRVLKIFAVTRGPSRGLQEVIEGSDGRVVNIPIPDLTDEQHVGHAAAEVEKLLGGGQGLDVLVNNAGQTYLSPEGFKTVPADRLKEVLEVNVVGPHVVIAAFLPLLEKGREKKVVNISSELASLAQAPEWTWGAAHAYKVSKTALNMLTVQYALDLKDRGFTVFAVSPGWLKTDMGSDHADLPVEVGVEKVKDWILDVKKAKNGQAVSIDVPGFAGRYTGKEIPW